MKFIKSNFAKKLIIILVVLMIFNIAIPKKVHAAWNFSGILMKPITSYVLTYLVSVDVTLGFWLNMINVANTGIGSYVEDITSKSKDTDDWTTAAADGVDYALNMIFIGPDTIFSGRVKMLNANIFNSDLIDLFGGEVGETGILDDASESVSNVVEDVYKGGNIIGTLKKGISTTYVILRNICAMIMLAGLIFTGIRILVTSNTPNMAAQWRQYMFDWFAGMILLIFSHVVMYGIFYISDLITASLGNSLMGFRWIKFSVSERVFM